MYENSVSRKQGRQSPQDTFTGLPKDFETYRKQLVKQSTNDERIVASVAYLVVDRLYGVRKA